MKKRNEIYLPASDTSRNPLLPFDQISSGNNESRGRENVLMDYLPNILQQLNMRVIEQQEKLSRLQKINDPSYQEISFKESLTEIIEQTVSKRLKYFRPDQNFMLAWNFFMLIIIVFNFLEIPLSLFLTDQVYQFQLKNDVALSFNIVFVIGLLVDTLFVRMNLAFYRNGKLITKRSYIFANYLHYDFVLDLISWTVYLIYLASESPKLIYLKLLFYLKFRTLSKINSQVLFALSAHRIRFGVYRLLRTIALLWIVTTWVSCIYFAIDYYFYQQKGYYFNTGQLWLTNSNSIDNLNLIQVYPYWYIWYEYAVYWSFQTSATIGYGDMTPRNPHQVFYCNFIILINTIFFAFYINTIWQIIGDLQEFYVKYTQNWTNLKQYLKSEGIDTQLSGKIDNFLQEMWINENADHDEDEFNDLLSNQLKTELVVSLRTKFFTSLHLFEHLNDTNLLWAEATKKLSCLISKQKFGSGHQIYEFGDNSNQLYYLAYGKVGLNIDQLGIGREVDLNHHFCVEEFLAQKRCLNYASTLSFCIIWKISRQNLIDTLKNYPQLYYKYCELKQRLLFQNEVQLCGTECLKCKSLSHNHLRCPKLNSWRSKIKRPQYGYRRLERSENEERKRYIRRENRGQRVRDMWMDRKKCLHEVYNYQGYRVEQNIGRL